MRRLKDSVIVAKGTADEQTKVAAKLQSEIDALVILIAEQEKAMANDGSRDSARTEMVAPLRGHRSVESEMEALAVRQLP